MHFSVLNNDKSLRKTLSHVGICDTCNKEFGRSEKEQSCLDWCEYADQCRKIIKRIKR